MRALPWVEAAIDEASPAEVVLEVVFCDVSDLDGQCVVYGLLYLAAVLLKELEELFWRHGWSFFICICCFSSFLFGAWK